MKYRSTRDFSQETVSAQAIAQGICENGGLFVPETFPKLTQQDFNFLQNADYQTRAQKILSMYLTDFSAEEIEDCVRKAYTEEKFPGGPAPLSLVNIDSANLYLLELWHGPTCAFKDIALQLLPHLLTKSLQKIQTNKTAIILVATSGDTGKAALEGFRDVPGTKILVFYPEDGVSAMQKRQMVTQEGKNVFVCAIAGNFDDAQSGVKKLFTNPEIRQKLQEHGEMFSSANSINLGRLLPQIVYYISAYCDLVKESRIKEGEQVNIVVPTGNFGNILAAYYAKQMGLPVHKLICASNSNNVLTDFLRTGVYDRNRTFYTTISPSMDILISSNLERLLSHLTKSDSQVHEWMDSLSKTGRYEVTDSVKDSLKNLFWAGCCNDESTKQTIHNLFCDEHYLCDPHTAVAVNVYHQYLSETKEEDIPAIIASTASPYKFSDNVLSAILEKPYDSEDDFQKAVKLSELSDTEIPEPIKALSNKKVRFTESCHPEEMKQEVLKFSDAE